MRHFASSSGSNAPLHLCLGCTAGQVMPMGIPGTGGRERWAASEGYRGQSVAAEIRAVGSVENCQELS